MYTVPVKIPMISLDLYFFGEKSQVYSSACHRKAYSFKTDLVKKASVSHLFILQAGDRCWLMVVCCLGNHRHCCAKG